MKQKLGRILKRKAKSHKGDFGHVFIIAGSRGLTGAACLAAQACLVSGAGLVTVGIPESLNQIIECKLTEAMSLPLCQTRQASLSLSCFEEIKKFAQKTDIMLIGPGLSQNKQTQLLIRKVISKIDLPTVIDADAINALAANPEVLKKRSAATVITPHPGEMARLLGLDIGGVQKNRRTLAKKLATMYNIVTILKGYQTVVAGSQNKMFVNNTGNPGMAKGGSGDVLTGIIAAFMAQGLTAFDASMLAVHVHGLAADHAVKKIAKVSLLATDIIASLPVVLLNL
jgi:NAD(P)H-hydrate epimerase